MDYRLSLELAVPNTYLKTIILSWNQFYTNKCREPYRDNEKQGQRNQSIIRVRPKGMGYWIALEVFSVGEYKNIVRWII